MKKITYTEQSFRYSVMPLTERDETLWKVFRNFPEIASITIEVKTPLFLEVEVDS